MPDVAMGSLISAVEHFLDADRQAPRHEEGDRGAGASIGCEPRPSRWKYYRLSQFREGKWLELLKQIALSVTRVAMVFNPDIYAGFRGFGPITKGGADFGAGAERRRARGVYHATACSIGTHLGFLCWSYDTPQARRLG
jgi:hypothetical protein